MVNKITMSGNEATKSLFEIAEYGWLKASCEMKINSSLVPREKSRVDWYAISVFEIETYPNQWQWK